MTDVKTAYGSNNQSITMGSAFTTLAASTTAGQQSDAIDNGTNKFLDALVVVKFTVSGAPGSDKAVYVYAYGTADGGTSYTEPATGANGALTIKAASTDPVSLRLIGVIPCMATGAHVGPPMSIASAFGGVLPEKWGIVVQNATNLAFTAGSAHYQGLYNTVS